MNAFGEEAFSRAIVFIALIAAAAIALMLTGCGSSLVVDEGVTVQGSGGTISSAELCSSGSGSNPCLPGAVCVESDTGWTSCVCCQTTLDGGLPFILQFRAASATDPAFCAQLAATWSQGDCQP